MVFALTLASSRVASRRYTAPSMRTAASPVKEDASLGPRLARRCRPQFAYRSHIFVRPLPLPLSPLSSPHPAYLNIAPLPLTKVTGPRVERRENGTAHITRTTGPSTPRSREVRLPRYTANPPLSREEYFSSTMNSPSTYSTLLCWPRARRRGGSARQR